MVDAPFLNLTPGTRTGVIHDEAFAAMCEGIESVRAPLEALIADLKRAEEQRASERTLKSIRRAFREALLALPAEEYDWFEVHRTAPSGRAESSTAPALAPTESSRDLEVRDGPEPNQTPQPPAAFFETAGPLYSVRVSPASSVVKIGANRTLRAVCRDRSGRQVDDGVVFAWTVVEGGGSIADPHAEVIDFRTPDEPGLTTLNLVATQRDVVCEAKALVTVTDSLLPSRDGTAARQGLPGYTYENSPGQLWRSRYEVDRELIVINSGHRDFVFASGSRASHLRYIARLFIKELVLHNFRGAAAPELLDRVLELTLYMESNLK